jgi:ABC-2 type transport system ATP-binding protein
MDEAERLCDRVAIVDHGRVIALGSPRDLIAETGGEHVIDFALEDGDGRGPLDVALLADLPAVRSVRPEADHFCLAVTEPHVALPALLERLRQHHYVLASLTTRHASLEDVFVTLTGRHLRDGEAAPS